MGGHCIAETDANSMLTMMLICLARLMQDWRESLTMSFVGTAAALVSLCLHSIGLPSLSCMLMNERSMTLHYLSRSLRWILAVGLVVLLPSTALSVLLFAGTWLRLFCNRLQVSLSLCLRHAGCCTSCLVGHRAHCSKQGAALSPGWLRPLGLSFDFREVPALKH